MNDFSYQYDLKVVEDFENYIITLLNKIGITIQLIKGKSLPENLQGFEISKDRQYVKTDNIFIELFESVADSLGCKKECGDKYSHKLMRNHALVIGDEKNFWVIKYNNILNYIENLDKIIIRPANKFYQEQPTK
jgi:hypothetical protein